MIPMDTIIDACEEHRKALLAYQEARLDFDPIEAQSIKHHMEISTMEINSAKRIHFLEEEISSIEETLHDFQMAQIKAYDHAQISALKKDIRDKKELLKRKYTEYSKLLSNINEMALAEKDTADILKEVSAVSESSQGDIPADIHQKLDTIKQEIKAQNKSAAAKFKVVLPIVPLLANYELELDTETVFGELWRKIRGLLKTKADIAVNPK
jgi:hypothetical protein